MNLAEELRDDALIGNLTYRVGLLYAAQGQWQPAAVQYLAAEARLAQADSETLGAIKRDHFAAQIEIANTARGERRWDDAEVAYRSAMALSQELNQGDAQQKLIAASLVQGAGENADALREQQDLQVASVAYQQTLETARDFGDRDAEANALYNLGIIAAEQKQWSEAKNYYAQVQPLWIDKSDALFGLEIRQQTADEMLDRQRARLKFSPRGKSRSRKNATMTPFPSIEPRMTWDANWRMHPSLQHPVRLSSRWQSKRQTHGASRVI